MLQHQNIQSTKYPRQFWIIFGGNLFSMVGTSMIWPFLTIFASQRLDMSLTAVASLLSINSIFGLLSAFISGPLTDRAGRRKVMIIGLALHGLTYLLLSTANTYGTFAVLMAASGFVSPIYRVGVDAMVADLVPDKNRPDAYALLRMGNNIGVAIGPSIGGFLATQAYEIVFYCAAIGLFTYSLLMVFFSSETMPEKSGGQSQERERFGGYGRVLKDKLFLTISAGFTINTIAASLVFVLLAVYAKEQFQIPESQYGFIMAANALMVILFQVSVTRITKRFSPYPVLILGALLYSIGIGSVALGSTFVSFMLSMIIMTSGELILVPTTTTMIADLAPPDMRGRYMSIYGLSWGIATGIGPILGGVLSDYLAPMAIWVGGFFIGLLSMGIFVYLALKQKNQPAAIS